MILSLVAEILVLIVVIALRRLYADQRQDLVPEKTGGQFFTGNELFRHHKRIVKRRQRIGLRQLRSDSHLGQTDGRSLVRRLDDQRQTETLRNTGPIAAGIYHLESRRRDAGRCPHHFRAHLVHRQRRSHYAAAGIRNAHQFQCALHRAVFAVTTVQCNEHAGKAVALELKNLTFGRVKSMGIETALLQCFQHIAAAHQ